MKQDKNRVSRRDMQDAQDHIGKYPQSAKTRRDFLHLAMALGTVRELNERNRK